MCSFETKLRASHFYEYTKAFLKKSHILQGRLVSYQALVLLYDPLLFVQDLPSCSAVQFFTLSFYFFKLLKFEQCSLPCPTNAFAKHQPITMMTQSPS